MLQVSRLAQKPLAQVQNLIHSFVQSQLNDNGGFCDRRGQSDLYYTVFALECLHSLQKEVPSEQTLSFLQTFGNGEKLDLVHISCLVRCYAALSQIKHLAPEFILQKINEFAAKTKGFHVTKDSQYGSAYGNFLVLGIYQDLQLPVSESLRQDMIENLENLCAKDGGYSNIPGMKHGNVPATAAAVSTLRELEYELPSHLGMWLLNQCSPQGGFCASPEMPVPDLLSTATALYALSTLKTDLSPIVEPCLDFTDSLWTKKGGFYGSWADDILDCEYTYYGLLALGNLSL